MSNAESYRFILAKAMMGNATSSGASSFSYHTASDQKASEDPPRVAVYVQGTLKGLAARVKLMDPDVVPRMCAIADDGSDYRSQATKDFLRRREALAAENVQQRRFLIVEFDGIKCLEADSGQLVQKFASLRDECMREGEVAEDL